MKRILPTTRTVMASLWTALSWPLIVFLAMHTYSPYKSTNKQTSLTFPIEWMISPTAIWKLLKPSAGRWRSEHVKDQTDLDFVGDVGEVEDPLVGGDHDGLLTVILDGAVEPLVRRRGIGLGVAFQFGRRIVQRHRQLRVDCRAHAANYRSICIP